jgi:hypothetical protein
MPDTLGNLEQVAVAPMKTHRAVREAMNCQAFLVHRPEVPNTYDNDIANLVEWLDFASFSLAEEFHDEADEMPARRQLYNDILDCVTKMERRGLTVLVGVMHAPQPKLPDWKVAILSITPKLTDPGAIKRIMCSSIDEYRVAEHVVRGHRRDHPRYLKLVSAETIYRAHPLTMAFCSDFVTRYAVRVIKGRSPQGSSALFCGVMSQMPPTSTSRPEAVTG